MQENQIIACQQRYFTKLFTEYAFRLTLISLVWSDYAEGVVAQWCNPLTLKPEQSGGVGSIPGRTPPLERHDKGLWTQVVLSYFCDPSAWR